MRALCRFLPFVLACSNAAGPSSCPTVDELARGSSPDRKDLAVIVAECRAARWSTAVVQCLRDAPTDDAMEPCFKRLTADQQQRLEAAFTPLERELDAKVDADKRAHDETFRADLAKRDLGRYAARAAPCTAYLTTIDAVSKQLAACTTNRGLLEIYAFQTLVTKQLDELATLSDDAQLAEACTRNTGALRDEAKMLCRAPR